MRETNLFIVIDEETLETWKDREGNVRKFETESGADFLASTELNSWTVVHIHLVHNFIHHTI